MPYWGTKGIAGRFYDKGDGFLGDTARDFGKASSKKQKSYSGKSGKVVEFEPVDVGTKVKSPDRGNIGTVLSINGDEAKVLFVSKDGATKTKLFKVDELTSISRKKKTKLKAPDDVEVKVKPKPDETPTIKKKVDEIDRRTPFINLSKVKDPKSRNELEKIVQKLDDEGKLRRTERKGLLQMIKESGLDLWKNQKKFAEELLLVNRIAPHLAKTIFASRHNILAMAQKIRQLRVLADEAVTPKEKSVINQKLLQAIKQKMVLTNSHIKNIEGVSDALNQQKLMSELSDADRLRIETDEAINTMLPEIIANIEKLPFHKQFKALKDLSELAGGYNDFAMRKMINTVNKKVKDKKITFADAWNEYTTANLLGDLTTHEVNIISAAIRYQMGWAEDYFSGIISMGSGEFRMGWNQIQMANDLLAAQFRFFNVGFKKAALAWKSKQNIGDILEHRLDGTKLHSMETWLKSMKETDSAWKNIVGHAGTPLAKLVYTTLRGLQTGDAFMKNIFQRAARVAAVNQRIRASYPELWKKRGKWNKLKSIRQEENIRDLQQNIRWESAKDVPNEKLLAKLNKQLHKLEKENVELSSFEQKFKELYFQYEDEFGNFRQTRTFNEVEGKDLDELSKSVINDPTYVARISTFTQNLKNEALDPNQFYPNQQQSPHNLGNFVLKTANRAPLLRVLTGLHFLKTPINLFKDGWKMTPVLNRLNMEFRAMTTASDPIVRSKASGIKALGATVYGVATYMAMNGMMTGIREKDHKKRLAFVFTDDNGDKRYVSMMRLFPLTIPFMVTAIINEKAEEFADMWSDKTHSLEQSMLVDLFSHISSTGFAIWSNVFSSQLMTQDFFEMMGHVMQTNATQEEANSSIDFFERWAGKTGSKHIPLATFWRWSNKVMAEGEAQLIKWQDHFLKSSPYAFLQWANEMMGGDTPIKNFGNSLSRKRDPLGNFYPKSKGLLLGDFQDIFPTTVHWSSTMVNKNGEKIELSNRAKTILQNAKIDWERPAFTFDAGFAKRLNMKELMLVPVNGIYVKENYKKSKGLYIHYPIGENEKTLTFNEGATLYEALNEVKAHITLLDGMTLNERFQHELENPNSMYNTYYALNRRKSGKYEGDVYLLSIIREYESAAKEYIFQNAYVEYGGRVSTIANLKEYTTKIEAEQAVPIPENLRMIIPN